MKWCGRQVDGVEEVKLQLDAPCGASGALVANVQIASSDPLRLVGIAMSTLGGGTAAGCAQC